ncbi:zinc finger protein [Macleaya cordata]|uniref:Zinc finger protein n=1 Tax=Macleaya cordata TaxID=56857 RepID=A0A200QDI6_MACCD|nr:zinc finger protein [Macleaya cordata]
MSTFPIDQSYDLDLSLTFPAMDQYCYELDVSLTMMTVEDEMNSSTAITATPDSLASNMPTVAIVDTCSICMGGPEIGEEAGKQMPCNHVYHANCISTWLSRYNSCPLCRRAVTASSPSDPDPNS